MQPDKNDKKAPLCIIREQSEISVHAFFNSSPESVFLMDRFGTILEANETFAARMGKSREESLGCNIYDLLPAELAAKRKKKTEEILRSGKRISFEDQLGSQTLQHTVYPSCNPEGTIDRLLVITEDITDIKRTEKTLQHEQAFSHALIDATPGIFCMIDENKRLAAWNPFLRDTIAGKAESEIRGSDAIDLIHPEDRPLVRKQIENVLGRGSEESAEVRILLQGGPEFRWVLLKGKRIVIDDHALMIGIGSDITDRKQAEVALHESERKFRSITEQMAEMVFVTNASGYITYVSPAIETIAGYTEQDALGHLFTDFFVEDEIPRAIATFQSALQDHLTAQVLEFRYKKKNGSFFYGEVHVHYYHENGSSGAIGLVHDITERKRNENLLKGYNKRLLDNQQFLKSIYEGVNHSIFVVDLMADGTYCYKGNNPLHETLTGIPNEVIAGKKPENLLDPEIAAAVISRYDSCVRKGCSIRYEERLTFMGKESCWETVLNPVRNDNGYIYRIIGTSTNITERKAAAQQLHQLNQTLEERIAEKTKELELTHQQLILQEKLASIGQLAAGIAHELNNPLNFIKINFATLREDFTDLLSILKAYRQAIAIVEDSDTLPAQEQQKLHNMEQNLALDMLLDDIAQIFLESQHGFERITTIINSMRNFSYRHTADKKIPFDINRGIEDTLILARNEYRDYADVALHLEELPPVMCHPDQINQIVLNLIINSAQAIASQQRKSHGKITLRSWCDGKNICFSIADDGPGIPENIRNNIFNPFFTTKQPGKGTGLGLSISYDIIVQKHGGTLSVECPAEGGTIFTLTLPLQSNTEEITALPEEQRA